MGGSGSKEVSREENGFPNPVKHEGEPLSLSERLERLAGIESLPQKEWLKELATFYPNLIYPPVVERHIDLASIIARVREKNLQLLKRIMIGYGGLELTIDAVGQALANPTLLSMRGSALLGALAGCIPMYILVGRPLEQLRKKDWNHFSEDPLGGYIDYEIKKEGLEIEELTQEVTRALSQRSPRSEIFKRIFGKKQSKTQERQSVTEQGRVSVTPPHPIVAEYQAALTQLMRDLEQKRVLGNHELKGTERAIWRPTMKFTWVRETKSGKEELIDSVLPKDKFRIERGEVERPTIRFVLNPLALMRIKMRLFSKIKIGSVSFPHPNDYLRPDLIERVEISIGNLNDNEIQNLFPVMSP